MRIAQSVRLATTRLQRLPLVWLVLALLSGCQQTSSGPPTSVPTQPAGARIEAPPVEVTAASEEPADDLPGGRLIEETWDAYSMRDAASGRAMRIGYAHTTTASVHEEGRELIRTRSHIHTTMQRSGQTINQDMTLTSWDTSEGDFVRFESRMSAGSGAIVTVGAVREGILGLDTTTLGRTQSQKIPWKAEWGGLFAPERSLSKAPLKPGEKRTVCSLQPLINLPANTDFEALDYETIELPSGSAKLLKVKATTEIAGQRLESLYWLNDRGESLKSVVPSIGQEAVRTTKEDALRQRPGEKYDLLLASTVPLKGTLPNLQQTRRAVYRAHLKSGQIAGLFSDCLSQRVTLIDEQTVKLTVFAIRPDQDLAGAGAPTQWVGVPSPTEADLASNNFIQSDDRLIAEMAAHVAPDEADPWKLAWALEKFVADAVHNKNFSSAFATAAEVARSLEGDCTEHAVLMAALCRVRKIPARCAFGLIYYPPEKGFAYHMWNEVWIRDRWVPMDPTLGKGGIGADHIKLGDSNLSGGSPLADLLAVIQVFGRLELEVVETE
jgi:hypothetical protein